MRELGDHEKVCGATIYNQLLPQLKELPGNAQVTRQYCQPSKFSGLLCVDGKYVSVKGYEKKIPVIYGIDYWTHDIPHNLLVPSESYLAYKSYFTTLKNSGYRLFLLIADDNPAIRMAAEEVYPQVVFQLCVQHYKENIRRDLNTRSSGKYQSFLEDLEGLFSLRPTAAELLREVMLRLYPQYEDGRCRLWLEDIVGRRLELTNHHRFVNAPNSNNLIEVYNSHLEQRLKPIKGFKSFKNAALWLNAYFLRRRLKPFTSCCQKFRHLNGKYSLRKTQRKDIEIPKFF